MLDASVGLKRMNSIVWGPMSEKSRPAPRVLWLSNYPAPYRFSVWSVLGDKCTLKVLLLWATEPARGWTWPGRSPEKFALECATGSRMFAVSIVLRLLGVARRLHDFDVLGLGGWDSPAYWLALAFAKLHRKPVVGFYESTLKSHRFIRGPIAYARRRFLGSCDALLTPGDAATEALQAMGVDHERIITSFNAVDVSLFRSVARRARSIESGPSARHRYAYVGQLISRKNVIAALRAFAQVGRPTDSFEVVGSGPCRSELEAAVRSLAMCNRVVFSGACDEREVAAIYGRIDTLVLPSTQEVWGLVANEALAAGCHVVISNRAGAVPSLRGMRGVFLCDPDEDDVARAMHESRSSWRGPILDPEVLQHTPEKLAEDTMDAIWLACRTRELRPFAGAGRVDAQSVTATGSDRSLSRTFMRDAKRLGRLLYTARWKEL